MTSPAPGDRLEQEPPPIDTPDDPDPQEPEVRAPGVDAPGADEPPMRAPRDPDSELQV